MKKESGSTDTVTTAEQRRYMQPLSVRQILIVKQKGKTFYADPDTIPNQVYTGYRVQDQGYKQAQLLASRQNPALSVHPDPHGVVVNEFDGWIPGPLAPIDGDSKNSSCNRYADSPRSSSQPSDEKTERLSYD